MYYCKDCHSKFKADDALFYMKTPANQVTSALNMYYEGMSIKAIARNLMQEHGNMHLRQQSMNGYRNTLNMPKTA
jgi:transposase-like protein